MSDKPALAWPDHDTGPTPPPEYTSRERDEERRTRKPLMLWDRVKILLLLAAVFGIMLANTVEQYQIMPLADAVNVTLRTGVWVLVLAGLELLRQLHYLVSEHWAPTTASGPARCSPAGSGAPAG